MAMQDAQVRIDFATQFDGRALARAEKQFQTFQRTLKGVAKSLGVTLSVAAVVAYSKASVKAASEDSKAQRVLANQLANVGLSFEKIRVENFISQMEKTTGILDDELRPAFAQLLRVTGSVTKTQELLGVAFDAGAGSGVGFTKAISILSQAYVGNYKSVRQLNLGLTQQELKTISVNQLIDLMKTKFKNAGAESVSALDLLSVGLKNVQEQFGFGLTDSFALSKDKENLDKLTKSMDDLQKSAYVVGRIVGGTISGISALVRFISKIPTSLPAVVGKSLKGIVEDYEKSKAKAEEVTAKQRAQNEAARRKAEMDAIARNKAIAAQQKSALLAQQKSLALQKLSNFLRQAQKVFDNEAITLAAAAQGKLTDEERARLKLKQDIYDLEQAINDGNVDAATKIAQTLYTDAQYLGQLRSGMLSLSDVPDPFKAWLETLKEILATLPKTLPIIPPTSGMPSWMDPRYTQGVSPAIMYPGASALTPASSAGDVSSFRYQAMADYYAQQSNATVNIQINPAVAGLINVIQDQSASGVSPTVNRINTSYIA